MATSTSSNTAITDPYASLNGVATDKTTSKSPRRLTTSRASS